MENKKITIGEKIEEEFNEYMKIYKTLKECGNPRPANVILSEYWLNKQFVAEQVRKKLDETLGMIKEQENKTQETKDDN
jgi:hypothetical protein